VYRTPEGYLGSSDLTGTFGNPNTKYFGPGLESLLKSGQYDTKMGADGRIGIVLGKYTRTTSDSKTLTDLNEVEIADRDSDMFKDAYDLALKSGAGYSGLDYNRLGYYSAGSNFQDMQAAKVVEDIPQL